MGTKFKQVSYLWTGLAILLIASSSAYAGHGDADGTIDLEDGNLGGLHIEEAQRAHRGEAPDLSHLQESFVKESLAARCQDERAFVKSGYEAAKKLSMAVAQKAADDYVSTKQIYSIDHALPRDRSFIPVIKSESANILGSKIDPRSLREIQTELKELGELLNYKIILKIKDRIFSANRGKDPEELRLLFTSEVEAFFDEEKDTHSTASKDRNWIAQRIYRIQQALERNHSTLGCEEEKTKKEDEKKAKNKKEPQAKQKIAEASPEQPEDSQHPNATADAVKQAAPLTAKKKEPQDSDISEKTRNEVDDIITGTGLPKPQDPPVKPKVKPKAEAPVKKDDDGTLRTKAEREQSGDDGSHKDSGGYTPLGDDTNSGGNDPELETIPADEAKDNAQSVQAKTQGVSASPPEKLPEDFKARFMELSQGEQNENTEMNQAIGNLTQGDRVMQTFELRQVIFGYLKARQEFAKKLETLPTATAFQKEAKEALLNRNAQALQHLSKMLDQTQQDILNFEKRRQEQEQHTKSQSRI